MYLIKLVKVASKSFDNIAAAEFGIIVAVGGSVFICIYFCPLGAAAPTLKYKLQFVLTSGIFNIEVSARPDFI